MRFWARVQAPVVMAEEFVIGEMAGACVAGEFAEQAVALEAADGDRQHLPDDVGRRHHMGRLQISGAADDLAGIAGGAFEQHIHGLADHGPVEGRLLAIDQFLQPHQSLVHLFSRHRLPDVRRRRAWPRRILERIGASVPDLPHQREGTGKIFLALTGEAHDEIR